MKKKEFTSKLQFRKNTIVSFNIVSNIKGGTLQNVDTQVVSVDGYMCLTDVCTPTRTDTTTTGVTDLNNTCPRPTNSRTDTETVFCGIDVTRGCIQTNEC